VQILETIKLSTRINAKIKTRKNTIWQQVQIYQTSHQVHNNVNEWNNVAGDAIQRTFQLLGALLSRKFQRMLKKQTPN